MAPLDARSVIQKQDRLLYYAFYLLLNLAEDITIERKMRKLNVVEYLIQCLDRSNVDLLLVAMMFLKKLSIFQVRLRLFSPVPLH